MSNTTSTSTQPQDKSMENEQLTELNALFTYEERVQQAAQRWIEQNPSNSLESRNFNASQNFWARIIAGGAQVKIADMLEAANKQ